MQNAKCRTDDKPRAEGKLACAMPRCEGGKACEAGLMQNHLPKGFKIGDDEIIFVRSEGAKAEHTLAYVSISATEALVQKELIRTILP